MALLAAVVVVTDLLGGGGKPRQPVTVTVEGQPVQIVPGTTLGAVAARIGLRPRAGSLLDVQGKVIRAGDFPGAFAVNRRPATGHRRLFAGDAIAALAGRDRREVLRSSVVPEPGVPSNPQFFVDRFRVGG